MLRMSPWKQNTLNYSPILWAYCATEKCCAGAGCFTAITKHDPSFCTARLSPWIVSSRWQVAVASPKSLTSARQWQRWAVGRKGEGFRGSAAFLDREGGGTRGGRSGRSGCSGNGAHQIVSLPSAPFPSWNICHQHKWHMTHWQLGSLPGVKCQMI